LALALTIFKVNVFEPIQVVPSRLERGPPDAAYPKYSQGAGDLTHKKMHPSVTLPQACAYGCMVVLGGGGGFV
jgi:hypothetical protein